MNQIDESVRMQTHQTTNNLEDDKTSQNVTERDVEQQAKTIFGKTFNTIGERGNIAVSHAHLE